MDGELQLGNASFEERLHLTRDRACFQEALTDPNQTVRAPLKITHSITLSLHLVLFFSPLLLSQLFNVLIILPQLYLSFSHIRMVRLRLRENQFGARNGGLEWLFNLGQTCAVPHSPHFA